MNFIDLVLGDGFVIKSTMLKDLHTYSHKYRWVSPGLNV